MRLQIVNFYVREYDTFLPWNWFICPFTLAFSASTERQLSANVHHFRIPFDCWRHNSSSAAVAGNDSRALSAHSRALTNHFYVNHVKRFDSSVQIKSRWTRSSHHTHATQHTNVLRLHQFMIDRWSPHVQRSVCHTMAWYLYLYHVI